MRLLGETLPLERCLFELSHYFSPALDGSYVRSPPCNVCLKCKRFFPSFEASSQLYTRNIARILISQSNDGKKTVFMLLMTPLHFLTTLLSFPLLLHSHSIWLMQSQHDQLVRISMTCVHSRLF